MSRSISARLRPLDGCWRSQALNSAIDANNMGDAGASAMQDIDLYLTGRCVRRKLHDQRLARLSAGFQSVGAHTSTLAANCLDLLPPHLLLFGAWPTDVAVDLLGQVGELNANVALPVLLRLLKQRGEPIG